MQVDIPRSDTFIKKKQRSLSKEELKSFLSAARTGDHSYYFPLICLLAYSGTRISEAVALQWSDIDFSARHISIYKNAVLVRHQGVRIQNMPKSDSSVRIVPMPTILLNTLFQLKQLSYSRNDADFIFKGASTGTVIRPDCVDGPLRKIAESCSIKPFGAHVLRHTYATTLHEAGVDAKVIQTLMGHSCISVTMDMYVHVKKKLLHDAMATFDEGI